MKTSRLALTFAFSAIALTPALAAEPAAGVKRDSGATTAVAENGVTGSQPQARRICRNEEVTGTRVPGRRLCLTKDEWRRLERGETIASYRNTSRR